MDVDLRLRGLTRPWSACSFVLVDQAAEDLAAFDPAYWKADQACTVDWGSKVQRPSGLCRL
jgi:hypothetical protein